MSVDAMIEAIEQVVCVRKIWRCRAGWGMMFMIGEPEKETVFAYQATLEECVVVNYKYWILDQETPCYPIRSKVAV